MTETTVSFSFTVTPGGAIETDPPLDPPDPAPIISHIPVATINNGGNEIEPGLTSSTMIPLDCTIRSVQMLADQAGSIAIDIRRSTFDAYPDGESITGGKLATIADAAKAEIAPPLEWDTAIAAGDILAFRVESASIVTSVTVALIVEII